MTQEDGVAAMLLLSSFRAKRLLATLAADESAGADAAFDTPCCRCADALCRYALICLMRATRRERHAIRHADVTLPRHDCCAAPPMTPRLMPC